MVLDGPSRACSYPEAWLSITKPTVARRTVLGGVFAAAYGTAARAAGTIKVAAVDAMTGPPGYSGLDACRGAQAADAVNAAVAFAR